MPTKIVVRHLDIGMAHQSLDSLACPSLFLKQSCTKRANLVEGWRIISADFSGIPRFRKRSCQLLGPHLCVMLPAACAHMLRASFHQQLLNDIGRRDVVAFRWWNDDRGGASLRTLREFAPVIVTHWPRLFDVTSIQIGCGLQKH